MTEGVRYPPRAMKLTVSKLKVAVRYLWRRGFTSCKQLLGYFHHLYASERLKVLVNVVLSFGMPSLTIFRLSRGIRTYSCFVIVYLAVHE